MSQVAVQNPRMRMQISSRCRANDWFKHYNKEKESEAKEPIIKKDVVLERLKGIYQRIKIPMSHINCKCEDALEDSITAMKIYENSMRLIKGMRYSASDVTDFVNMLPEFQGEDYFELKSGGFISALINNCKEKDFKIITHCLGDGENIDFLGLSNTKNITVFGNTGGWPGRFMEKGIMLIRGDVTVSAGWGMTGGEIIIRGNAGSYAGNEMRGGRLTADSADGSAGNGMTGGTIMITGNAGDGGGCIGDRMTGGKIIIKGDAKETVGFVTKNGTIIVEGNAGSDVGDRMEGGTIHLNGDYRSLADEIKGGNIYHKGKLIVKNGRKLV